MADAEVWMLIVARTRWAGVEGWSGSIWLPYENTSDKGYDTSNNIPGLVIAELTAKHQFICITTFTFDFLAAELIDEARMKNNKSFIAMAFCDKSKLLLSLQCSHYKKTDHEKPMCFVKYPHKKKKHNAA